jgi:hypothetical protein
MTSEPTDKRELLRRTLIISGALVGACVLFVGTLTLVAASALGHAIADTGSTGSEGAHSAVSPRSPTVSNSSNGAGRHSGP